MESVNWEVPQISVKNKLPYTANGPLMIVKIDTSEYELDSISSNNIDGDWIKSIHVIKKGAIKEKYGYKAENGVVIIRLFEHHNKAFLEGMKAVYSW